jgi:hypothetical protein
MPNFLWVVHPYCTVRYNTPKIEIFGARIGPWALHPKDSLCDAQTQLGSFISSYLVGVHNILRRMEMLHLVCVGVLMIRVDV